MATSNHLEDALLGHVLNNSAYSAPTTLYLALFTGSAGTNLEANNLSDEVSDTASDGSSSTGYNREVIAFNTASGGSATSDATGISFSQCINENWGNISFVAIMDSATVGSGNVLFYGQLSVAKLINVGDTLQLSGGAITVTMD